MTREEAIDILFGVIAANSEEENEALDMAIEALENKSRPFGDCSKCIHTYGTLGCCTTVSNEWVYDCEHGMEQYKNTKAEPSEDGTLEVKVEDATKIGRVLISDDKHRGGLYYPDEYEPKGEDLISRAEALMEARPEYLNPEQIGHEEYNKGWSDAISMYWANLNALPAKTQDRPTDGDIISRAEAIYEIHDFFSELMDKLPITVDEDDDEVITDAKTANTLLVYNKMLCKRFDALPSADRPRDGDLISRADAIEALGEEPLVWCDDDYEIAERSQWRADIEAIKSVPSADRPRGEWIDKEELIDAINDAQFVYDSDEGGHKEYDITELVRVIFKDIISNLSSADMRGDAK